MNQLSLLDLLLLSSSSLSLSSSSLSSSAAATAQMTPTTTAINPNGPRAPHSRLTGFDITVVSKVMAVLALAQDLPDVCDKLRSMVVGYSFPDPTTGKQQAVTADD
ncbi:hypothetical protein ACA910_005303 [Epithemia clementina (nom. ined.)]